MPMRRIAWGLTLAVTALFALPAAQAGDEPAHAAQGVDGAVFEWLRSHLDGGAMPSVRSVLVMRSDELRFEWYRNGLDRDSLHQINSATKSVVSMLVGVAIQRGTLAGLDQKLAGLLPEASAPGVDPRVKGITVRHLLTMSSGFAWDERARDACRGARSGDCARFDDGGDPIAYALQRPLAHAPGQVFNYDSPSVDLLAVALARASGSSLLEFAQQTLGRELGITRLRWQTDARGNHLGGRGIEATARDLVKLGHLALRRGAWQGRQLVPAHYMDAATSRQTAGGWPWPPWVGYGFLWWVMPERAEPKAPGSYAANGFGGQYIWVAPEHDAVVVITADPFAPGDTSPLLRDFIMPALGRR